MPNINDAFPGKYLKVADLLGHEPIVTIDHVDFEPVGRDREMKAVAYFVGKTKGIVLNKTMATKLIEISGSAITEEWAGLKVKLYASEASYGGDTYDVVRIKAATNGKPAMSRMTPLAPPKPKPTPISDDSPDAFTDEINDSDIPF